jgi:hypothetical protein
MILKKETDGGWAWCGDEQRVMKIQRREITVEKPGWVTGPKGSIQEEMKRPGWGTPAECIKDVSLLAGISHAGHHG